MASLETKHLLIAFLSSPQWALALHRNVPSQFGGFLSSVTCLRTSLPQIFCIKVDFVDHVEPCKSKLDEKIGRGAAPPWQKWGQRLFWSRICLSYSHPHTHELWMLRQNNMSSVDCHVLQLKAPTTGTAKNVTVLAELCESLAIHSCCGLNLGAKPVDQCGSSQMSLL